MLVIVLVASLVFTGCTTKSTEKELRKVVVAEVTHSLFYTPQYVALSEGFFAEEGLDVEFVTIPGADKTMSALLSKNDI